MVHIDVFKRIVIAALNRKIVGDDSKLDRVAFLQGAGLVLIFGIVELAVPIVPFDLIFVTF